MSGPAVVRAFIGGLPPSEDGESRECDLPDRTDDGNKAPEFVGHSRRRHRRAKP